MKSSFWANNPVAYATHDQPSIIVVEKRKYQLMTGRVSEEILR